MRLRSNIVSRRSLSWTTFRSGVTALLLHNGKSGFDGRHALGTIRGALAEHDVDVKHVAVNGRDAAETLDQSLAPSCDLVLVAGGDGTVGGAAKRLAGTRIPLGVLPTGTKNHFARDAGIPLDLARAVDVALTGREADVDVGRVGDQVFVNNASVGLYPGFVRARQRRRRWHEQARWRATLAAASLVWRKPPRLRLKVARPDAPPRHRTTPVLFVGNNEYETGLPRIGRRKSLSAGHLCLYVTRRKRAFSPVRLAGAALAGRLDTVAGLEVLKGDRFWVDAPHPSLRISLDGEVRRMNPPLDFRIEPKSLRLRVPANQEEPK